MLLEEDALLSQLRFQFCCCSGCCSKAWRPEKHPHAARRDGTVGIALEDRTVRTLALPQHCLPSPFLFFPTCAQCCDSEVICFPQLHRTLQQKGGQWSLTRGDVRLSFISNKPLHLHWEACCACVCMHGSSVKHSAASIDVKHLGSFVLVLKWATLGMLQPEVGFLFSTSTSGDIIFPFHITIKIKSPSGQHQSAERLNPESKERREQ